MDVDYGKKNQKWGPNNKKREVSKTLLSQRT